ncbi:hypothetical protein EVAR_77172_1 [Eumeta japonica]|uniref:Uncharacterized protein n=1 Tax=Eumeta variegata TaxID=151549 RepID=A0A4C1T2R7_EUMVA|nr:hypothetical protein EVAR_77172_1 [Eumeta japonica]
MSLISGMLMVKKKILLKPENIMRMKLVSIYEDWLSKTLVSRCPHKRTNCVAFEDVDHGKEEEETHAQEETPACLHK